MQKIASIDHETKIHHSHETVNVLQFTINYWRQGVEGIQPCGPHMKCEWTYSDNLQTLRQKFHNITSQIRASRAHSGGKKRGRPLTLAVYNIHSWWERMKEHGPDLCNLPTTLNLAESEESRVRYHMLFDPTFKHFDGFSTTHPTSHIQRVYDGAFINSSQFIGPLHNFSYLIKAASYVAGDCHKRDSANANRDHYVYLLRKAGFRVEGLGRCMHTTNPEGTTWPTALIFHATHFPTHVLSPPLSFSHPSCSPSFLIPPITRKIPTPLTLTFDLHLAILLHSLKRSLTFTTILLDKHGHIKLLTCTYITMSQHNLRSNPTRSTDHSDHPTNRSHSLGQLPSHQFPHRHHIANKS